MTVIDNAIHWATQRQLNLSAQGATVTIKSIDTPWHSGQGVTSGFVELFKRNRPWPQGLPLIIVAYGSEWANRDYAVVDGSHRLEAAERADYKLLPVIVVAGRTVDALVTHLRPDDEDLDDGFPFDEILAIYAKTAPLVRQNLEQEKMWERQR